MQRPVLRWGRQGPVLILRGEVDRASGTHPAAVRDALVASSGHPDLDASAVPSDVAGLQAALGLSGGASPVVVLSPGAAFVHLLDLVPGLAAAIATTCAVTPIDAPALAVGGSAASAGIEPDRTPALAVALQVRGSLLGDRAHPAPSKPTTPTAS